MTERKPYDYLIVGAGLFGSTFAYLARQQGKRCLVIDRREQLGGNVACRKKEGIDVHLSERDSDFRSGICRQLQRTTL